MPCCPVCNKSLFSFTRKVIDRRCNLALNLKRHKALAQAATAPRRGIPGSQNGQNHNDWKYGGGIISAKCGHLFHNNCLNSLITNYRTKGDCYGTTYNVCCPICGQTISNGKILKIDIEAHFGILEEFFQELCKLKYMNKELKRSLALEWNDIADIDKKIEKTKAEYEHVKNLKRANEQKCAAQEARIAKAIEDASTCYRYREIEKQLLDENINLEAVAKRMENMAQTRMPTNETFPSSTSGSGSGQSEPADVEATEGSDPTDTENDMEVVEVEDADVQYFEDCDRDTKEPGQTKLHKLLQSTSTKNRANVENQQIKMVSKTQNVVAKCNVSSRLRNDYNKNYQNLNNEIQNTNPTSDVLSGQVDISLQISVHSEWSLNSTGEVESTTTLREQYEFSKPQKNKNQNQNHLRLSSSSSDGMATKTGVAMAIGLAEKNDLDFNDSSDALRTVDIHKHVLLSEENNHKLNKVFAASNPNPNTATEVADSGDTCSQSYINEIRYHHQEASGIGDQYPGCQLLQSVNNLAPVQVPVPVPVWNKSQSYTIQKYGPYPSPKNVSEQNSACNDNDNTEFALAHHSAGIVLNENRSKIHSPAADKSKSYTIKVYEPKAPVRHGHDQSESGKGWDKAWLKNVFTLEQLQFHCECHPNPNQQQLQQNALNCHQPQSHGQGQGQDFQLQHAESALSNSCGPAPELSTRTRPLVSNALESPTRVKHKPPKSLRNPTQRLPNKQVADATLVTGTGAGTGTGSPKKALNTFQMAQGINQQHSSDDLLYFLPDKRNESDDTDTTNLTEKQNIPRNAVNTVVGFGKVPNTNQQASSERLSATRTKLNHVAQKLKAYVAQQSLNVKGAVATANSLRNNNNRRNNNNETNNNSKISTSSEISHNATTTTVTQTQTTAPQNIETESDNDNDFSKSPDTIVIENSSLNSLTSSKCIIAPPQIFRGLSTAPTPNHPSETEMVKGNQCNSKDFLIENVEESERERSKTTTDQFHTQFTEKTENLKEFSRNFKGARLIVSAKDNENDKTLEILTQNQKPTPNKVQAQQPQRQSTTATASQLVLDLVLPPPPYSTSVSKIGEQLALVVPPPPPMTPRRLESKLLFQPNNNSNRLCNSNNFKNARPHSPQSTQRLFQSLLQQKRSRSSSPSSRLLTENTTSEIEISNKVEEGQVQNQNQIGPASKYHPSMAVLGGRFSSSSINESGDELLKSVINKSKALTNFGFGFGLRATTALAETGAGDVAFLNCNNSNSSLSAKTPVEKETTSNRIATATAAGKTHHNQNQVYNCYHVQINAGHNCCPCPETEPAEVKENAALYFGNKNSVNLNRCTNLGHAPSYPYQYCVGVQNQFACKCLAAERFAKGGSSSTVQNKPNSARVGTDNCTEIGMSPHSHGVGVGDIGSSTTKNNDGSSATPDVRRFDFDRIPKAAMPYIGKSNNSVQQLLQGNHHPAAVYLQSHCFEMAQSQQQQRCDSPMCRCLRTPSSRSRSGQKNEGQISSEISILEDPIICGHNPYYQPPTPTPNYNNNYWPRPFEKISFNKGNVSTPVVTEDSFPIKYVSSNVSSFSNSNSTDSNNSMTNCNCNCNCNNNIWNTESIKTATVNVKCHLDPKSFPIRGSECSALTGLGLSQGPAPAPGSALILIPATATGTAGAGRSPRWYPEIEINSNGDNLVANNNNNRSLVQSTNGNIVGLKRGATNKDGQTYYRN